MKGRALSCTWLVEVVAQPGPISVFIPTTATLCLGIIGTFLGCQIIIGREVFIGGSIIVDLWALPQ